ncbi:hypothetical protein BJ165DRAFT_1001949 [Panaeolus papilionaceus]|nr:hypothetical protein BJ165DRAFT_1001949 [Panaeolus papilionaceus]
MIRKTLLAAVLAFSTLSLTNAAFITVYAVDAPLPSPTRTRVASVSVETAGTVIASAIGPGESGRTKYEVKNIQSRIVLHRPGIEPNTVLSEPMTATYTYEQGGNVLIEKGDPLVTTYASGPGVLQQAGLNVECTLDNEKKSGVCAGEHLYAVLTEVPNATGTVLSTATETVKTTYTGSIVPVATISTGGSGKSATRSTALFVVASLIPINSTPTMISPFLTIVVV